MLATVQKRRHHFLKIFAPLSPRRHHICLQNKLLCKIIFWQTSLSRSPLIDEVFYEGPLYLMYIYLKSTSSCYEKLQPRWIFSITHGKYNFPVLIPQLKNGFNYERAEERIAS